jgi:hypothetical protein
MSTATAVPTSPSLGKAGADSENQGKKSDLRGAHIETPQDAL